MTLDQYTHGRLLSKLYKLEPRFYATASIAQPYYPSQEDTRLAKQAILSRHAKPIIILQGYGIVAGIHTLEGYKALGYDRVPVLLGKL
jgi:hypothetical protein